ncbi:MAG: hypothetical protein D6701_02335 [Gemmatimonadetes bacterium]|nr:MAG: hypothetical protein D6701_02335 [Gemmatimonadota bacterium]
MRTLLRKLRGAIGLGLTWAVAGFGLGAVMELVDRQGAIVDIWPMFLAVTGLLSGGVFSLVLGIAGRNRRFDELSMGRFASWGALSGGIFGGLILGGFATGGWPANPVNVALILGVPALGSAAAAAATLAVARGAEDRTLLEERDRVAEVGLSSGERKELLGEDG